VSRYHLWRPGYSDPLPSKSQDGVTALPFVPDRLLEILKNTPERPLARSSYSVKDSPRLLDPQPHFLTIRGERLAANPFGLLYTLPLLASPGHE
jgi:hypothetical protein